jgi:DNA-binding response OmpR family regulator
MSAIVLVADEPDLQLLTQLVLERDGHQVVVTSTAEEALRLINQVEPDVVVLDISLPGMDSWQMIGRLANPAMRARIVVLTAHAGDDGPLRAATMGCGAYLRKPFAGEQLLAVVRDTMIATHRSTVRPL